ncbi:MAG TPA: hypothetical protein VHZ95_11725, partial [Polyangiales bacterium]|nr:hypothetical protein [Polyangiales bacterium]
MKASPSLAPHVLKYARRLSVRLWSIHALRGLCLAAGAGALAILIASTLADPILTRSSARWVWGAVGLAAMLGLFASLAPLRRYRGAGIARVVEPTDPALSHRMRSALELAETSDDPGISRELLAAHLNEVQLALEVLPEKRVLPWSRLLRANLLVGLGALAFFAAISSQRPALRSFVRALLTPAQERSDGTRIAKVVTQLRVQLTFPSYLARDSTWLSDPDEITAPVGTNLEFRITTRFPAERGKLFSGSHATPLTAAEDGTLRGRISASETMALHVELESRGVRYED